MNSSFYNGVSGIKTHQFGMDVWADNVANIGNHGFRANRPEFSNLFSQTLSQTYFSAGFGQVGVGACSQTTAMDEQMGSLVDADNDFDMAIGGEGWFATDGGDGETYYTRRGDFLLDEAGNLVTQNGNILLGTLGGNISGGKVSPLDDIQLAGPTAQQKIKFGKNLILPTQPTTNVKIRANLNPEVKTEFQNVPLNEQDITSTLDKPNKKISINGTINNTTEAHHPQVEDEIYVTITDKDGKNIGALTKLKADGTWSLDDINLTKLDVDNELKITARIKTEQEKENVQNVATHIISPKGEKQALSFEFKKRVPQQALGTTWDVSAKITNADGTVIATQNGTIEFNERGIPTSSTLASIPNGGAAIKLDLGKTDGTSVGITNSITATHSASYGTSNTEVNGYIEGSLRKYQVNDRGYVHAIFNNGKSIPVARIPVYHFQNDQGLSRASGDFFQATPNSGEAFFYTGKDGRFTNGTRIAPQMLETSNVSLATALTEIIVMQKAFDASSKSITTSDQMLQRAINMKK